MGEDIQIFALDLSNESVTLLHYASGDEWTVLGEVAIEDPNFAAQLKSLRQSVTDEESSSCISFDAIVRIPRSKVLFGKVQLSDLEDNSALVQIHRQITEMSSCKLEEIIFDLGDRDADNIASVGIVEQTTLMEADSFAKSHGFKPIYFTTSNTAEEFSGEPHFYPAQQRDVKGFKRFIPWAAAACIALSVAYFAYSYVANTLDGTQPTASTPIEQADIAAISAPEVLSHTNLLPSLTEDRNLAIQNPAEVHTDPAKDSKPTVSYSSKPIGTENLQVVEPRKNRSPFLVKEPDASDQSAPDILPLPAPTAEQTHGPASTATYTDRQTQPASTANYTDQKTNESANTANYTDQQAHQPRSAKAPPHSPFAYIQDYSSTESFRLKEAEVDPLALANPALADKRPQARSSHLPSIQQPQAETIISENSIKSATAFAVASSQIPKARPASISLAVNRLTGDVLDSGGTTQATAETPENAVGTSRPSRGRTSAFVARNATEQTRFKKSRISLVGVFGTPNARRALVRLPTDKYIKLQKDDKVDGWRVSAIGEKSLHINKGSRSQVLRLP